MERARRSCLHHRHLNYSDVIQLAFNDLDAPPVVVGARNWITPPDEVEDSFFPFPADFLDAIHEYLQPLAGYVPGHQVDDAEVIRRSTLGV